MKVKSFLQVIYKILRYVSRTCFCLARIVRCYITTDSHRKEVNLDDIESDCLSDSERERKIK